MSLIRKHRAVLQAWACLALVSLLPRVFYVLRFETNERLIYVKQRFASVVQRRIDKSKK